MTVRASWLLPTGQTRDDTRLSPVGTMAPAGPLTSRSGVIPGGAPLTATGSGMSVQIGTGRAVVQGTAIQGAYPVAVTAPETLSLTDGSAQFPRIDTVVLRVRDGLFDTSGQTLATVEIVEGTAEAAPSPPVLPPASLPLYDIRVPAGASAGTGGIPWASALTDRRVYTAAAGGILPGAAADVGAYDGAYADHGGRLMRWSGPDQMWRPVIERHYASTVKADAYNLAAATYTRISWTGTDAMSTVGMWSAGAPSRLAAPVGGLYVVYVHQTWPNGASQARTRVQVNATGDIQLSYMPSSSGGQGAGAARPLVLAAGDYVEMSVYSAAALTGMPGSYSKMALQWIGP